MGDAKRWCGEREGAIDEVAFVVRAFATLGDDGRADVLDAAACALAQHRMRTLPVASAESDDAREWLAGLADHTMPRDDEATGLIVFARSVEPSVQSMLFDDGVLGMLLGASTGDWLAAEGLLSVYLNLRDDCDSMGLMPEPAAALGIRVARDDFERWHEDEWVVDEVAWRAEVHRRCTASVAGMLALWRSRFFEALLESKRHTT